MRYWREVISKNGRTEMKRVALSEGDLELLLTADDVNLLLEMNKAFEKKPLAEIPELIPADPA